MSSSIQSVLMAGAILCAASAVQARTIPVHSGGSIRAALARAEPGDTIEVLPGVYREGAPGDLNALTVTIDGIHLVGRPHPGAPVVLENAGTQGYGVWVSPANSTGPVAQANDELPPCGFDRSRIHGFSIQGFTVRGFEEHGVHLACVDGFSIANNVADGNHVYGLFPVLSQNGAITGNLVRGTDKDAAIYVGQSDHVMVAFNRSENSLLGLEVENSRDCTVVGNEAVGNTLGITVDILPGKIEPTQQRTFVAFNRVHDNNKANTADPSDSLAVLPPGIGILLAGADATTVTLNDIHDNGQAGVAVVSLCLFFALQGFPACPPLDVIPESDANHIVGNRVVGNGATPGLPGLSGDLVWDGTGSGNCWSSNQFGTSSPSPLPACP
jgi:parallel beta-helix repeat protein